MGEFNMCKHNYNITFDLWFYTKTKNKEHHAKYKINIIASFNFLNHNILVIIEAEVTERIHTLSFRFSFGIAYCDIYKNHENEIEQKLSGLGFLVNQKKSQVASSSTTIQRLGFLINKERDDNFQNPSPSSSLVAEEHKYPIRAGFMYICERCAKTSILKDLLWYVYTILHFVPKLESMPARVEDATDLETPSN
ncbi:hypothetical protein BD770DRAFT_428362 [Pilaira anomala]|nr:hypothetical protein BD770DRAFT_428362 [Pilaira anomala]